VPVTRSPTNKGFLKRLAGLPSKTKLDETLDDYGEQCISNEDLVLHSLTKTLSYKYSPSLTQTRV